MAVGAVGVVALVVLGPPSGEPTPPRYDPAVAAVVAAARQSPVVLIGEYHGSVPEHAFLRRLAGDPALREVVDDVVVEFGNARFQRDVDRYVAGRPVDERRLQRAWLETTQGPVWSAPVYAAFFRAVREQNRRFPPARRLRVLLADPPYDPARARAVDPDLLILQRSPFAASLIQRQVLARGRRALVIIGAGHVLRRPRSHPTLTNLLERRSRCEPDPLAVAAGLNWCDDLTRYAAARTYVIAPDPGGVDVGAPAAVPRPAVATVAGTSLGGRPLADVLGEAGDEGEEGDDGDAAWTVEQAIDGLLVLGSASSGSG